MNKGKFDQSSHAIYIQLPCSPKPLPLSLCTEKKQSNLETQAKTTTRTHISDFAKLVVERLLGLALLLYVLQAGYELGSKFGRVDDHVFWEPRRSLVEIRAGNKEHVCEVHERQRKRKKKQTKRM